MKTNRNVLVVLVGLVAMTSGCVVIPARYITDKDGKVVMVEPERIVPAPITVNTYPVYSEYYYPAPVYYPARAYHQRPVVVRRYSYPVARYYPTHVRPIYIGGGHHHGYGHHSHR